jgi:hypothetical protein
MKVLLMSSRFVGQAVFDILFLSEFAVTYAR